MLTIVLSLLALSTVYNAVTVYRLAHALEGNEG